jgi:hypothetical protein
MMNLKPSVVLSPLLILHLFSSLFRLPSILHLLIIPLNSLPASHTHSLSYTIPSFPVSFLYNFLILFDHVSSTHDTDRLSYRQADLDNVTGVSASLGITTLRSERQKTRSGTSSTKEHKLELLAYNNKRYPLPTTLLLSTVSHVSPYQYARSLLPKPILLPTLLSILLWLFAPSHLL